MFKNKKIVALIPLRGGSKSIPYKNIKKINKKPLAYWVCSAASKSKYIDHVYISTEDKKIKKIVEKFGFGVTVIERPAKYAQDESSTESVMIHFSKNINFDILVTLQATSPLTSEKDIDDAIERFFKEKSDSLLTGVVTKRFFWDTKKKKPINYNFLKRPRRQKFQGVFMENGAFYITKKEILKKYNNRLGGNISFFEMNEQTSVELDEPQDWKNVENLLKLKHYEL